MAFHQSRDVDRAHQQLHASHYSYLDPDEAHFVTPVMIRIFCIAGQADEIIERLHELEAEGLNAINFSFPLARQYRMTEDFATRVIHRMQGAGLIRNLRRVAQNVHQSVGPPK